jgi:hypothetical protein
MHLVRLHHAAIAVCFTRLSCSSRTTAPTGHDAAVARDAAPRAPIDAARLNDATPPIDAGPATRDLRPALDSFFNRLGKRQIDAIWDAAHERFRAGEVRKRADRMMRLLLEPLGGYREIVVFRAETGDQRGDNTAFGTVQFEHGVAPYRVGFRDDGEVPRLLFFNIDLPKELEADESPEQARTLAEMAATALLSGDLAKFRPFAHPALDEQLDAAQARELKVLAAKLGLDKRAEVVKQEKCKGQCFEMKLIGSKTSATAMFRMTKVFGRWKILSFDLAVNETETPPTPSK